jgi:hypothetical protein
MEARHARLYDQAFGKDPAYWRSASPVHVLTAGAAPLLAVCSSRRSEPCPHARQFAAKAASLGARAQVLEQDLSHGDVNKKLGQNGSYTQAVESFMGTLDDSVRRLLAR